MKLNKYVLGLLVVLTVILVPKLSVSSDTDAGTVVLTKDNLLILNSQVDGSSTSAVIAAAKKLDTAMNHGIAARLGKKKPLYLFLNTPGGSIQSGLELIEALQGLGRPVNTVTLFAASMGFQIAQNLDDRLIIKNGVLMSHRASGEFTGSFGGIHPSQLDARYQLWLDRVRELDEQTVKRTNGKQTYESYLKQYNSEMWLTGTKSVEQGYADKIVKVKCDSSLNGVTTQQVEFMGMVVEYDLDNCPINTAPMNVRLANKETANISEQVKNEIKNKFLTQFQNKESQVLPMMF